MSTTEQQTNLKLLFIGNSYTYYNKMPELLLALAAASGQPLTIETVTDGGATLQRHWLHGKALAAIREGDWDYVVLQEHSQLGRQTIDGVEEVNGPAFSHSYVRLFDQAIQQAGAETLLTQTWADKARPETQVLLDQAFYRIGSDINASVVPVGSVWQQIKTELSDGQDLYSADGFHPSPLGSLVSALVFYVFFAAKNKRLDQDLDALKNLTLDLYDEKTGISSPFLLTQHWPILQAVLALSQQAIDEKQLQPPPVQSEPMAMPKKPAELPVVEPFSLSQLLGRWSGQLELYSTATTLELDIEKGGDEYFAAVRILQNDALVISVRVPVFGPLDNSGLTDSVSFYLEIAHDFYGAVFVDGVLKGIVRGDLGHYPEPNRFGQWTLQRQPSS